MILGEGGASAFRDMSWMCSVPLVFSLMSTGLQCPRQNVACSMRFRVPVTQHARLAAAAEIDGCGSS